MVVLPLSVNHGLRDTKTIQETIPPPVTFPAIHIGINEHSITNVTITSDQDARP